jgi:nucleoside 2-deoxyribosyltransferase
MKIYFAHSNKFDFKNDFYAPIKDSDISEGNELIFPHEDDERVNSREIIKNCDLLVAEVSYSGTGLGIELGWASAFGKRIICIYQKGVNISQSLMAVTDNFFMYNKSNLAEIIKENLS